MNKSITKTEVMSIMHHYFLITTGFIVKGMVNNEISLTENTF